MLNSEFIRLLNQYAQAYQTSSEHMNEALAQIDDYLNPLSDKLLSPEDFNYNPKDNFIKSFNKKLRADGIDLGNQVELKYHPSESEFDLIYTTYTALGWKDVKVEVRHIDHLNFDSHILVFYK